MLKKISVLFLGLCQLVLFLIAAARPAHAYVDPGSGLLVFQVGGSMLAGALFVLRSRIRKLFGLKSHKKPVPVVKLPNSSADGETRA